MNRISQHPTLGKTVVIQGKEQLTPCPVRMVRATKLDWKILHALG